jgi:hypothetical protein
MAQLIPIFEKAFMGSGTVNSELWIDLSAANPDPNSPIPSGKQIWVGYATFISDDKTVTFEIRPNLPTKALGNTTETQLRASVSITAGESKDLDLYYYGNIMSLAPVSATSTGVEKLWLRVKSGSNSAGAFSYIVYYTLY